VPIVLQKSFWGDERNFLEPLMRFTSGDVRDHIVSSKSTRDLHSGVEKRHSGGGVQRSTFARFFGSLDFRLLQQYPLRSRHRQATRSGPVGAVSDILHRSIQHIIRSSCRRSAALLRVQIAEISPGSAINITSEVIDHGHRPRPHRRCRSCLIISRASRRDAHLENPLIGPRWSGSIQRD